MKATAPVAFGHHYTIIPIGQKDGIATNCTDGSYDVKASGRVYDYRLHVNFYTGLWVTTN
jgi:hypothetical protein